jgi:hypothetical protein
MNIIKSYSDSGFPYGSTRRYQLYQLGNDALNQGHLASALKWLSLAATPDPSGNTSPRDQKLQAKATRKLEALRNKIAMDEFQKAQETRATFDESKLRTI